MDIATILCPGTVLSANPHYYDYIHYIELAQGGTVKMVGGAGQALRREIVGKYRIVTLGPFDAEVYFYELSDVDPYARTTESRPVADFTSRVTLEKGPFVFKCEVVWKVSEDDWPFLLCDHRLVFDDDPLASGQPKWPDFPPEALEVPEIRDLVERNRRSSEAARRYYAPEGRTEMPQHEIKKLGLPPEAFID
jgi:hypothetical protein